MCSVCHQSPCDNRCPNAPEPIAVDTCCECGNGIYEGDEYYEGSNGPICKNCMRDMSVEDVLQLLGESLMTA